MIPEIEELYQEVILDHSRRPRNFGELPDAAVRVHGDNPACGDEIHLAVKFDGGGGLEDIKFTGRGCAISQASASLMTMKLKGKSRTGSVEMLHAFHDLVTNDADEAPKTPGRSPRDEGSAKFSAASEMRDAPLAGGGTSIRAGRGRSDHFDRTSVIA